MNIYGNSHFKGKLATLFAFSKPVNNRDSSPRTASARGLLPSELSNRSDRVNDSPKHRPSGRPKRKITMRLKVAEVEDNAIEASSLAALRGLAKPPSQSHKLKRLYSSASTAPTPERLGELKKRPLSACEFFTAQPGQYKRIA